MKKVELEAAELAFESILLTSLVFISLLQNCSLLGCLVAQMVKESACNTGDLGLIPELGRSPGEGNSYPLQYSCLENSMDRGARWATVLGLRRVEHN